MIGRKLSHFRILDRIGEGGMGVVYRAEDEKLQRVVALKVLPPERLADEERRLRFVREARTAAAVTHPNIAVVHEIDESDGVVFIAMELIEGKTLRATIGGKPLALREALRLGLEIAEGVCAAHHVRVIHRDLKPDNVLVTHDGRVKILDFGLAKLLEERQAPPPGKMSELTTISDEMTQAGRVMGTAAYMSPEQARGLPVDARSDLFSLGVVLYEMVTGRVPFRGSTSMDTLTAILHKEAQPPSQVNPEVPAELERIIGKCLEKEPGERYQDTRDLVVDLRKLKRESESQPIQKAEITPKPAWKRLAWSAAALVVIGVAGVAAWRILPRQEPRRELIQRQITANPSENPVDSARISPDGRYIAYRDQEGIHVHRIDTGETLPFRLPGGFKVVGGVEWLPDGTGLFVFAKESEENPPALWSMGLLGGPPRKILDAATTFLPSPDGKHIAYTRSFQPREIWLSGPSGETPRKVLAAAEGEQQLLPLAWSPAGRRLAYLSVLDGPPFRSVHSVDLDGGPGEEIVSGRKLVGAFNASAFCWLPDGRFLYRLTEPPPNDPDTNLWAVEVDPVSGRRSGIEQRLTDWVGSQVHETSVTSDGTRLAVRKVIGQGDIYMAELDPSGRIVGHPRRLTMDDRNDVGPRWTPDSRFIVFSSARRGTFDIFKQGVDATDAEALIAAPGRQGSVKVTPDGHWVVYRETATSPADRFMRIPLAGGPPQLLSEDPDWVGLDCPTRPGASCVLRKRVGDTDALFAWDPLTGPGVSLGLARDGFPEPFRWVFSSLSPDGTQEAVYGVDEAGSGRIVILTVPRGGRRDLPVEEGLAIAGLGWSASSDALFAAATSQGLRQVFLRVNLKNGETSSLGLDADLVYRSPTASPDGRHLAYVVRSQNSNIWLLENF